jgi:DNA transformation protein and related proteins
MSLGRRHVNNFLKISVERFGTFRKLCEDTFSCSPMKEESFKDFVLDQLSEVQDFQCKKMPGGYGIYWGKNFFGIISDGKLFFRTNSKTVKTYLEARMTAFETKKAALKVYYEVPPYIVECREDLAEWTRTAMSS